MSPWFGKHKRPNTIAILDIESGSVGSALVTLNAKGKPRLFAQERMVSNARTAPSAGALLQEIERLAQQSLLRVSGVAANMRAFGAQPIHIDRVAVFLYAPWSTVALAQQRPTPHADEATLALLRRSLRFADEIPLTFHAFTATIAPVIRGAFNEPADSLVVSIGSEIAELSLMREGALQGYASAPGGLNTVLRTIESHAGVSRAEALSILTLSGTNREHAWAEAVASGVSHVLRQLREGAKDLLPDYEQTRHVFIVAPHATSEYFARTLTEDPGAHELFAPGSTVRAVSARTLVPHLEAHPPQPDVPLILESLFVDTRFGA